MGGKAMRREILTLKEACEYMNCSRSTIYKYMENEPDFPAFQEAPGCKLYFVDAALKAWVMRHHRSGKSEQRESSNLLKMPG
ncbi:DNA-binding protein [Eubacterium callanderi]|nr:DNA-binding protein [Eubacterium callanderi]